MADPATLGVLGGLSLFQGLQQAKIAREEREQRRKEMLAQSLVNVERDKQAKINNALAGLQQAFKQSLLRQQPQLKV